ncbi:MAG: M35 family metallopeptidase [Ginsengibacter sp.]
MESISAKLYSHDQYKKDEHTNLIFELTNHTKLPLHVLKWNTPLEGLKSDCLAVSKNGRRISYDGLLIKRGQPRPEDFVALQPGQSASSKINVGAAYNIASAGKIKVDYNPEKLTLLNEQPTGDSLAKSLPAGVAKKVQKKIETKPASFTIRGGTKQQLPIGAQLRQADQKKEAMAKKKPKPVVGLMPCVFKGGTSDQQDIVNKAHQNGYDLTLNVLKEMANNSEYKLWFGKYSGSRFKKVKNDYKKIRAEFEAKQFTYDLTSQGCDTGVFAYTYKGGTTIWLCDGFWQAPDTGTDSRAGTLVHERSHASAFTDDIVYGQEGCKKLAISAPAQAVNNADTHEYFAKG